ncbi:hypothetical protein Asi03nite_19800 [Actinoplanes siamensis]|uniref:Uncharacterized protein n=1 Tax=Actinoplanes siamensis TaxID=1223317 RepID=A0A919N4W6_9ACTN|nr:hypothetical protein Asi03nite_19800 [Actinoplanes siamensis]
MFAAGAFCAAMAPWSSLANDVVPLTRDVRDAVVAVVVVACWVCSARMRLWMSAMRAFTPSIPTLYWFGAVGKI